MKRRYSFLRPFSHTMGAACLIPGSSFVVQAFASKAFIYDIAAPKEIVKEISLPTKGVLKQFTLQQDLESGGVALTSEAYRFYITPGLELLSKKKVLPLRKERLCLGASKQQEVEALRRRSMMTELLPILFRLGNQIEIHSDETRSVFSLLERCRQEVRPEKINEAFQALYFAGFTPFLLPQSKDLFLQNLYKEEPCETAIVTLLSGTARWIRSLFFRTNENSLQFLPLLPPECVYGKWFDLDSPWGVVDFSWSKKELFAVTLRVQKEGELSLQLPSSVKSFRLREGEKIFYKRRGELLEVKKGELLLLDRFEK